MRRIDELLDQYSSDHQNQTNQRIHVICVPAIVWSVTALLWSIPVPGSWFEPGAFSALAMFLAWAYYWRLSRKLAMGAVRLFPRQRLPQPLDRRQPTACRHCCGLAIAVFVRRLDRTVHRPQGAKASGRASSPISCSC